MVYRPRSITCSLLLIAVVGCSKSNQEKARDERKRATESPVNGERGDAPTKPASEPGDLSEASLALNKYLSTADTKDSDANIVRLFRSERETASFREIRQAGPDRRLAILAAAMNRAETNPAVEQRLEDITHAVVGLDSEVRKRVIKSEIQPRLKDRTRMPAIQVGLFLNADADVPDFAAKAFRALLTAPAEWEVITPLMSHRLIRLAEQLDAGDFSEHAPLLAGLLSEERINTQNRLRLETMLVAHLAQADPQQPIADYSSILDWYLSRSISRRENDLEREQRCLAYLCSVIKQNSDVAKRLFADDGWDEKRAALSRSPELLAVLPAATREQLAVQESRAFLDQLEQQSEGSQRLELPRLLMAGHLPDDGKRKVAMAIIERMRATDDQNDLRSLVQRVASLASALTPQECVDVFELLEPSPFGDEKQPEVSTYSYVDLAENVSPEAADTIGKWLFDRLSAEASPPPHYAQALVWVVSNCNPDTATKIVQFFAKHSNDPLIVTTPQWSTRQGKWYRKQMRTRWQSNSWLT